MPDVANPAYPKELREAEKSLLHHPPRVGIAVSGGGIRSATFALGFFQALAALDALRAIDCLSTVSGGGYFGAFLGRLFTREYVRDTGDVEWVLTGPHTDPYRPKEGDQRQVPDDLNNAGHAVLRWLRENGRYLAPRGAGDLLLGAAVMLRNFMSIHVVLLTSFLGVFLLIELPRVLVRLFLEGAVATQPSARGVLRFVTDLMQRLPLSGTWLWWSPWVVIGLGIIALGAVPGWAYWLVGEVATSPAGFRGGVKSTTVSPPLWRQSGWIGAVVAVLVIIPAWIFRIPSPHREVAGILSLGALLAMVAAGVAWLRARGPSGAKGATRSDLDERLFRRDRMRHDLSRAFEVVLVVGAIVTGLAIVDSLGQTAYATWWPSGNRWTGAWFAALASAMAALGTWGRRIAVFLGLKPQDGRPRLSVSIVASVVAFVLVLTLLVSVAVLSHAVVWNFGPPAAPPGLKGAAATQQTVTISAPASQLVVVTSAPGPTGDKDPPVPRPCYPMFAAWIVGAALLACGFGRAFTFLNQSSHQALYAARLTRAYLGASNPKRWSERHPVVEPVEGDDIEVHEYWSQPREAQQKTPSQTIHDKGFPLHFLNVTINETYDGRSQIQQQDRKGTGLALGPAGMSVGIRHHVVFGRDADGSVTLKYVLPDKSAPFRVFPYQPTGGDPTRFPWEPLSLGRWVAVSGAAFSTGTGYRTSIGLSLLAGLANVRLGYWWDSRLRLNKRETVNPGTAANRPGRLSSFLAWVFPVQSFLVSELVARFPGTAHQYWYLSDGGHFENMGGYELIRRRLPFIVVIDAEADPDYTFEGLSNLVRKARLDFHTEITFDEGSLDRLRPIKRRAGAKEDPGHIRCSAARYATARVEYPPDATGGADTGRLLYIKPVLMGDEPADVLQYARANPPFPQQTTLNQFFDEAQWESYRRLGEFVAMSVLHDIPASETESNLRRFGLI